MDPQEIDAIILTHAHTDHIGYLPRLVKQGYRGPVYATQGTVGLCKISLPDGGRLQEEEARYHNKHKTSRHELAEPLYTEADAYEALKLLKTVRYFDFVDLPGKNVFRYLPAGHILGSAMAEIYFESGERINMTGDIGRYDRPIIKDPYHCDFAEYLVIESTYGNRLHDPGDAKDKIAEIMHQAYRDGSRILVPSFAIGRTQELLWYLHCLREEGNLPNMPIYVDSPMANAATLLYQQTTEDHDHDMKMDLAEGRSPFDPGMVRFVRDRNMSKSLNMAPGPFMVIAGSGMVSGGRIQHHLKAHLSDPSTILLFTGFQAQGTLGRMIMDGANEVKILGEIIPVEARVESLQMLSAHADYSEMLRWLKGFKFAPKKTFIVHGEPEASEGMKAHIESELGWDCFIPSHGQTFKLGE